MTTPKLGVDVDSSMARTLFELCRVYVESRLVQRVISSARLWQRVRCPTWRGHACTVCRCMCVSVVTNVSPKKVVCVSVVLRVEIERRGAGVGRVMEAVALICRTALQSWGW